MNNFTFRAEWLKVFADITAPSDRGMFLAAITHYGCTGQKLDTSAYLTGLLALPYVQIDNERSKKQVAAEKRAEIYQRLKGNK